MAVSNISELRWLSDADNCGKAFILFFENRGD
jgi:hypothetical protein